MEHIDIIIIAIAFSLLAFRLYQKYMKKTKITESTQPKKKIIGKKGDLESQSDDYEPYSNR